MNEGVAAEPCLFCDIVAGTKRSSVIYEDADVLVFMDLRQVTLMLK